MSIHLQRFIDRVRGFEARGAKDFTMSMGEAKDLHADISRLLITLETLRNNNVDSSEEVIQVQVGGGNY
jgi:hypothetical protein